MCISNTKIRISELFFQKKKKFYSYIIYKYRQSIIISFEYFLISNIFQMCLKILDKKKKLSETTRKTHFRVNIEKLLCQNIRILVVIIKNLSC